MPSITSCGTPADLRQSDPKSIEAQWGIRGLLTETTEIFSENNSSIRTPIKQTWAAAIVNNPWVGTPTSQELIESPRPVAARLSKLLSDRLLRALGGAEAIQSFGKGAIIGEAGEMEHGAALTHTPYFASRLRNFLNGEAVISFADIRARAGETLVVPLCQKHTGTARDHYQSVRVRVPDAPRANEIVLIAAAASGPRPFPRVGDRTTDQPLDHSLMNGASK